MQQNYIPFKDTGYFSPLITDYLDEKDELKPFYNRFPKLENFKAQVEEKQQSFSANSRAVLAARLEHQYKNIEASKSTLKNIELLKADNTFTITTGHQLNLFTGPLYFLYKIISTINLTTQLKERYPNYNFVPIYWMATEDHDFEEINYFNFKGKKIQWNTTSQGAVGELYTNGLDRVLDLFSKELGHGQNADFLKTLFENAYVKHDNLSAATHYLANQLFKAYGLVIIDANDAPLKEQFTPFLEDELLNSTSYKTVAATNTQLEKTYNIQVNPREINLFYLKENLRERLVFENGLYKVNNTAITFTKDAILDEVKQHPERFSPNVIMRPLYQEVILPNLCYIGGGGELAYWLQLKPFFDAVKVPFPILLLRNSVLIQTEKQHEKLKKLKISKADLFLQPDAFINKKVRQISDIDIDFSPQKEQLNKQFLALYELAAQTDKSFLGAVKAQEVKQLKGLDHLEKRLLKAQKRKLADQVSRMRDLQRDLFPNGSLQERNSNFSEFYLEYGDSLISNLVTSLQPLKNEFLILSL